MNLKGLSADGPFYYGISQAVTSELVIPKRNNLFGNAANYDFGVSSENQAKNVSYGTV